MKLIFAALVLLLIIVTPVLGKNEDKSNNGQGQGNNNSQGNQESNQSNNGNSNGNPGQEEKEEKKEEKAQSSTSPSVTKKINAARVSNATGSGQACDPNYPWKNHGEYVSCVAKSGAGGQAVSEAARSDIGKKNATSSASTLPTPTATGSAQPSISPSPEATSSGLINSITENLATVQEQIITIGDQFAALLDLLNPFN